MSVVVILNVPLLADQLRLVRAALEMGYVYRGDCDLETQVRWWETACYRRGGDGLALPAADYPLTPTIYPLTFAYDASISSCLGDGERHVGSYVPATHKHLNTNSIPHFLSAARAALAAHREREAARP